jgi:hypothetical protein
VDGRLIGTAFHHRTLLLSSDFLITPPRGRSAGTPVKTGEMLKHEKI